MLTELELEVLLEPVWLLEQPAALPLAAFQASPADDWAAGACQDEAHLRRASDGPRALRPSAAAWAEVRARRPR